MRTWLFQESCATKYEESVAKKQIMQDNACRIDELSMQQERNPTTVIQLLTRIQDLNPRFCIAAWHTEYHGRNLASSSCGLDPGNTWNHMEHKREAQSSSIPTPRFRLSIASLNPLSHTGGTYSHNGMMGYPRFPISDVHPGKFSGLIGISRLESQLQDWSLLEDSRSSSHTAVDPRSWDNKANRRTYDIAIDCGKNRFSWLRCA